MIYVILGIGIIILFYLALFKAAAKEDKFWEEAYKDSIEEE